MTKSPNHNLRGISIQRVEGRATTWVATHDVTKEKHRRTTRKDFNDRNLRIAGKDLLRLLNR